MTLQMRVAVAGAGYWGRNLVRILDSMGVLATVCDARKETLNELATRYPGLAMTTRYEDLLMDKDVSGVVIATPAGAHAAMVREAILAGKDVFVEKPLALTAREGEDLAQLARASSRTLMVGHLLWYHPAVLKLKELVSAGALGRVQYVYSNRLNMGKLRTEENVLWSFAPHDVSVVLGLLEEMPMSVQAQGGNYLHQRIADTTVTLLSFASGVRAHIFVSWLHPFKEQKLVAVGSEAMAVFDDTAPWERKLVLYPHKVQWSGQVPEAHKADAEPVALEQCEPLRAECEHFLSCMSTRAAPRTDADEGVRVLRILNACQRALEAGGEVTLAQHDTSYFVHESAVVDEDVLINTGTRIWHFSHVLGGTVLGEGCTVGQNVMIGPDVKVGNHCKIQNNVSIYKGVTLEDGVFCGPSCVFTNVNNPRAEVERKHEYRPTLVKRGATIGANATIVCGTVLGEYCFVGAGAVVSRDVPAHALVVGNPARQIGWMSACGEKLDETLICPTSGKAHRETDAGLEEIIP